MFRAIPAIEVAKVVWEAIHRTNCSKTRDSMASGKILAFLEAREEG